jgi:hypothetical protein
VSEISLFEAIYTARAKREIQCHLLSSPSCGHSCRAHLGMSTSGTKRGDEHGYRHR